MPVPMLQGAAELVGKRIGELCLEKNISAVSFDRGGNVYHGRVRVRCD
jgi:large subunit ribosomal protein L18